MIGFALQQVTESSESVLSGTKKPPFRLMVRCVRQDGTTTSIRPAVGEQFVVRCEPSEILELHLVHVCMCVYL